MEDSAVTERWFMVCGSCSLGALIETRLPLGPCWKAGLAREISERCSSNGEHVEL